MKTLKQEGVPFGARMVFRAQHVLFCIMAICLVLTIPFVLIWGLVHESGQDFIDRATNVISARLEQVKAQRAKIILMYGGIGA